MLTLETIPEQWHPFINLLNDGEVILISQKHKPEIDCFVTILEVPSTSSKEVYLIRIESRDMDFDCRFRVELFLKQSWYKKDIYLNDLKDFPYDLIKKIVIERARDTKRNFTNYKELLKSKKIEEKILKNLTNKDSEIYKVIKE